MTKPTIRAALLAGATVIVGTTSAMSATLIQSFNTTSAYNDGFGLYSNGHSALLPGAPGGDKDFDFETPGLFSIFDDGTATLTGTLVSDDGGTDYSYDVNVSFTATGEGSGGPKKELDDSAYSEDGGPVDTDTWSYFSMTSAVLTGLNSISTNLYLFEAPTSGAHPFQVGFGANGKNVSMGGSGWFLLTSDVNVDCSINSSSCRQGDFNLDFDENPAPVPLPAAGLLLPVALGALGFAGRRRKNAQKA